MKTPVINYLEPAEKAFELFCKSPAGVVVILDENDMPLGVWNFKSVCEYLNKKDKTIADFTVKVVPTQEKTPQNIDDIAIIINSQGKYECVLYPKELLSKWVQKYKIQNAELLRINRNHKKTQKKLVAKEKLGSLATLVAGVAHEINTPLGVCITATSILTDKTQALQDAYAAGSVTKKDFENFIQTTHEIALLLHTNLATAANLVLEFKQVSVGEALGTDGDFFIVEKINKVLSMLKPELDKKAISAKVTGNEKLQIYGQSAQFCKVITNLIMNSIQHGFEHKQDGKIRIDVESDGQNLCILYSDDGKGIDASIAPLIFEPFVTTAKSKGGTGLGMHIAYNVISQIFGGEIRCYESPVGGARFVITLPIQQERQANE